MTVHVRRAVWLCRGRIRRTRLEADRGMSTAEYAVGTLAACALGTLLYKLVTSDVIQGALQELLTQALHVPA
ncbi:DUF4244 domain-containing protein [Streptomyces oceani]|uniref:DUF4244 domain-containing protein n=1 Tax=Streptomyces oceani TaxID=1075402 RepID=UPI0009A10A68|nr:DUF4244 domain-containing protein [Streptomyces oceani]